jgi:hypothetical protein
LFTFSPSGQRAQLIARPSIATTVSPSALLRPQNVTGQVTLQQPQTRPHTIALQRPGGLLKPFFSFVSRKLFKINFKHYHVELK